MKSMRSEGRTLTGGWLSLVVAVGLGLCALLAPAASASPNDVTFEGETMTLPSSDGDKPYDADASGHQAIRIWNNGTATETASTALSSVHLFVRARGTDCVGAP